MSGALKSGALKRFWRTVEVAKAGDGFGVQLDGKQLKSPAGRLYALSSEALARMMVAEWDAVEGVIKPSAMPVTQIVATAMDHFPAKREEVIGQLTSYGETELLCHRAEDPPGLRKRQDAAWQPVLDALDSKLGIALKITSGVTPVRQDAKALTRIRTLLEGLNDIELVAMLTLVGGFGSIALALALKHQLINFEAAWKAAELDNDYQVEKWGEDAEAAATKRVHRSELEQVEKIFRC